MSASPSSAFFAWKHYHPREAEDPRAAWAAAWKAGGREALISSGRLAELGPMLQDLLHLFEDGQIEADIRATDRRPTPLFADDDDEPMTEVTW